jgi:hypothetical protein
MAISLEENNKRAPSLAAEMAEIKREIRKLWIGVNRRNANTIKDVPFVLSGFIFLSISPRFYLYGGGRLRRFLASIDTPGTTATVFTIYKNLDVLTTITLAAGVDRGIKTIDEAFVEDSDYLRVGITTVGAGAKGADVQCRFLLGR